MTDTRLTDAVHKLIQSDAITPEAMRLLWACVRANISILIYGRDETSIKEFGNLLASFSPDGSLPVYRLAEDGETITSREMILLYQSTQDVPNPEMLLFMAHHYRTQLIIRVETKADTYEILEISQRTIPTSDSVINVTASSTLQTLYERYQPSNGLKPTGTRIDFTTKLNTKDLNAPLTLFQPEETEIVSSQVDDGKPAIGDDAQDETKQYVLSSGEEVMSEEKTIEANVDSSSNDVDNATKSMK